MKPKLSFENAERLVEYYPHCDHRILHAPGTCEYCNGAEMAPLHEERERLGVNYTGHTDRPWPCPAEQARSSESLNSWHGNRAKP